MKRILQALLLISFLLTILPQQSSAQEFDNGEIGVTVNSWGRVRIYSPSILEGNQQIDRFSMLVGGNEYQVFDYANDAGTVDTLRTVENPLLSDTEIYVSVDNTYPSQVDSSAENFPPAVNMKVNMYGWNSGGYCLVKYTIKSLESETMMLKPGFEILPQVDGAYGFEAVSYTTNQILIKKGMFSTNTAIIALSDDINSLNAFNWYDGYNSSDTTLHDWLNMAGTLNEFNSDDNGAVAIGSCSSEEFATDQEKEIWLGFATGDSFTIDDNVAAAIQKYNDIVTDVDDAVTGLPEKFQLSQNYPNPFNPSTTINFNLPVSSQVKLDIFNSLGEKIASLLSEEMDAGYHTLNYNASDLSSGIYYYRIVAGEYTATKKMTFLK